ncbi:MAG: polyprenyl synthetase family protein [Lachnospiraceae bacterium]|nr:polyprenyl synthetase family protein [Lachnospiraceae bacterium]
MNFKERLAAQAARVDKLLEEYLPEESGHQKTIFSAMNYSVRAGGKRLRPILMEETYRLCGGTGTEIEPFMAAIEMIHTSSLVHDDLPAMDADEYRRGKKTTWVVYGEDMGILAGDALMIYAFETATKALHWTAYPERVVRAISILAEKTGIYGMIGGQTVDVELTGKPVPEDKLRFIYALKTGALLEASMMIGAVLSGADDEMVKKAGEVALLVGMAFQIQDDILDVTSTTEELGKPVLSDEKNQKTTYVTLYGLDAAAQKVKELSERAVSLMHEIPGENAFLEELILSLVNRLK